MARRANLAQALLERVKGIEPSYRLWKSRVLPLNYTRNVKIYFVNLTLLERVISKRNYLRSALSLTLINYIKFFLCVGVTGIGPATSRSQTERSTDELHPVISSQAGQTARQAQFYAWQPGAKWYLAL